MRAKEVQSTGSASQNRLLSFAQLPSGRWRDLTLADSSRRQSCSPTFRTPAAVRARAIMS